MNFRNSLNFIEIYSKSLRINEQDHSPPILDPATWKLNVHSLFYRQIKKAAAAKAESEATPKGPDDTNSTSKSNGKTDGNGDSESVNRPPLPSTSAPTAPRRALKTAGDGSDGSTTSVHGNSLTTKGTNDLDSDSGAFSDSDYGGSRSFSHSEKVWIS